MPENNNVNQPAPKGQPAPEPRIWEDPIGTGEPVPFDPEKFEPGMSDEELEELLKEEEDS